MALSAGEVHIWRTYLPEFESDLEVLSEVVSVEERARAERYKFEADRIRFLLRRAIQRQILGHYLKNEPADIAYETGANGKLAVNGASAFHFNATNSDNWYLLACTSGPEIGLDVEEIRQQTALDILAEENFGEEERAGLSGLKGDAWLDGFYRFWTCKEALLKAAGVGLIDNLHELEVSVSPAEAYRVVRVEAAEMSRGEWQLTGFQPFQNGTAALAWQGEPLQPQFMDLKRS